MYSRNDIQVPKYLNTNYILRITITVTLRNIYYMNPTRKWMLPDPKMSYVYKNTNVVLKYPL